MMEEGVVQGDPLAARFMTYMMYDLFKDIRVQLMAGFIDDSNLVDEPAKLKDIVEYLIEILPEYGLELKIQKCKVLDVNKAAGVKKMMEELGIPSANYSADGQIVLGTPTGNRQFSIEFVKNKASEVENLISMLRRKLIQYPNELLMLLTSCVLPKLTHATRVVDPAIVVNNTTSLDSAIRQLILDILGRNRFMEDVVMDDNRWEFGKLPRSLGGCGIRSPVDRASQAFLASIFDCARTIMDDYSAYGNITTTWMTALMSGTLSTTVKNILDDEMQFFSKEYSEWTPNVNSLNTLKWKSRPQKELTYYMDESRWNYIFLNSDNRFKTAMQVARGAGSVGNAWFYSFSGSDCQWDSTVVTPDKFCALFELRLAITSANLYGVDNAYCKQCEQNVGHPIDHSTICTKMNRCIRHDEVTKAIVNVHTKAGGYAVRDGHLPEGLGRNKIQPDATLHNVIPNARLAIDVKVGSPFATYVMAGDRCIGQSIRNQESNQRSDSTTHMLHAHANPHAAAHIIRNSKFHQWYNRYAKADEYVRKNPKVKLETCFLKNLKLDDCSTPTYWAPIAVVIGGGVAPDLSHLLQQLAVNCAASSFPSIFSRETAYNFYLKVFSKIIGLAIANANASFLLAVQDTMIPARGQVVWVGEVRREGRKERGKVKTKG